MAAAPDTVHVDVRITGRVQGVSFRARAHELADSLKLTGLVRNEPDGSVYAEVEGTRDAVAKFTAWCRRGPDTAEVRSCEWVEGPVKGYDRFTVYRGDGSVAEGEPPTG